MVREVLKSVVKEGSVDKLSVSAAWFKNWRHRRIVLKPDVISWYAGIETSPRGSIALTSAIIPTATDGCQLVIDAGPGKRLVLRMSSDSLRDEWLRAVSGSVQKLRDAERPAEPPSFIDLFGPATWRRAVPASVPPA